MLIPQRTARLAAGRQGRRTNSLAELRSQLASPARISDGSRQRLLDLCGRLARVQVLGDEYARVTLSSSAQLAMDSETVMG